MNIWKNCEGNILELCEFSSYNLNYLKKYKINIRCL